MIKNFAEIKEQLTELSGVINSFKSEAVQLRIVELLFEFEEPEIDTDRTVETDVETKSRKKKKKKKVTKKTPSEVTSVKKKVKRTSGTGGPATLSVLVEEGFFSNARTIGDIKEHCEHKLARKFKQSDFSGKLARLVRDKTLSREKNADNQYEYKQI